MGNTVLFNHRSRPVRSIGTGHFAHTNLTGLVHHSDHGTQYVSTKYGQKLAAHGIRSSTGSVGDSHDNSLAETVNGLYKTELIYSQSWRSRSEVEFATMNWVHYWNNHRPTGPSATAPQQKSNKPTNNPEPKSQHP